LGDVGRVRSVAGVAKVSGVQLLWLGAQAAKIGEFPTRAWLVSFKEGSVASKARFEDRYVRAVRSQD